VTTETERDQTRPRRRRRSFLDEIGEHLALFALAGLGTLLLALTATVGAPIDTPAALGFLLTVISVGVHASIGTLLGGLAAENGLRALPKSVAAELQDMAIATVVAVLVLAAAFWYAVVSYSTIGAWLLGIAVVAFAAGFGFEWRAAKSDESTVPGRIRRRRQDVLDEFGSAAALSGMLLALIVAVGLLAISAVVDTAAPQHGPDLVTLPNSGPYSAFSNYVALGDSYSAGEGLDPTGTCDQSAQAYGRLLAARESWHVDFEACSGAVIGDIFGTVFHGPQVKATQPQRDVGLVTLTIGGNDALFSSVVTTCIEHPSCMWGNFPPGSVKEQQAVLGEAPAALEHQWALATLLAIDNKLGAPDGLFFQLKRHFPAARIVIVGYPYLFPDGPAPLAPDLMCAAILRRVDEPDRAELRYLQDRFNDIIYEEALRWGIDFVTPQVLWTGHEPCGKHGQWTNSIELFLNLRPLGRGAFHPNSAGQHALAALVSCYLVKHPSPPVPQQIAVPSAWLVPPSALTTSTGASLPAAWGSSVSDFTGCGFK
jgi:hypothetical protein